MRTDGELLAHYAEDGSEASFAEVVRARAGFVYAAALRRATGDAHLASDITQQVFIALAKNARQLSCHPALSGWLYVATRNIAARLIRTESRRQKREKESALMQETVTAPPPALDEIKFRHNLDALLDTLNERDRGALLLRFFEGYSFAEIAAVSRLTENAARMRVERALEKLRVSFAKKGVVSTAAALSASLAAHASSPLPAALLTSLTHAAVASAGAGATAWSFTLMSITKLQTSIALTAVALGIGGIVFHHHTVAELEHEIARLNGQTETINALRQENSELKQTAASAGQFTMRIDGHPNTPEKTSATSASPVAQPPLKRKTVSLAAGLVPVENLAHAGRTTARDAFSTQIWAAALGDVDLEESSIALRPEGRAKLEASLTNLPEAARANYGTPERLMASVLAGSPHPVGGMQILGEKDLGTDRVVLETQWQHADDTMVHHSNVELQRDESGNWRMVVPMILVDRAVAYLQGNGATQSIAKKN